MPAVINQQRLPATVWRRLLRPGWSRRERLQARPPRASAGKVGDKAPGLLQTWAREELGPLYHKRISRDPHTCQEELNGLPRIQLYALASLKPRLPLPSQDSGRKWGGRPPRVARALPGDSPLPGASGPPGREGPATPQLLSHPAITPWNRLAGVIISLP